MIFFLWFSLTNQALMSVYFLYFLPSLLPSFHNFSCPRFLFQTITPGQSKGTSQTEWQLMTPSERLPFPRVHHCLNQDVCIITLMCLPLSVPLYLSFIAIHFLTVLNIHPTASMSMVDCDMINRGESTEQTKGCFTMSESVLSNTLWCDDHRNNCCRNSCCNLQSINPLQPAIVQQILGMLGMHSFQKSLISAHIL